MNRNIYETYKELNSLLPKGFVKLKVLKSPGTSIIPRGRLFKKTVL